MSTSTLDLSTDTLLDGISVEKSTEELFHSDSQEDTSSDSLEDVTCTTESNILTLDEAIVDVPLDEVDYVALETPRTTSSSSFQPHDPPHSITTSISPSSEMFSSPDDASSSSTASQAHYDATHTGKRKSRSTKKYDRRYQSLLSITLSRHIAAWSNKVLQSTHVVFGYLVQPPPAVYDAFRTTYRCVLRTTLPLSHGYAQKRLRRKLEKYERLKASGYFHSHRTSNPRRPLSSSSSHQEDEHGYVFYEEDEYSDNDSEPRSVSSPPFSEDFTVASRLPPALIDDHTAALHDSVLLRRHPAPHPPAVTSRPAVPQNLSSNELLSLQRELSSLRDQIALLVIQGVPASSLPNTPSHAAPSLPPPPPPPLLSLTPRSQGMTPSMPPAPPPLLLSSNDAAPSLRSHIDTPRPTPIKVEAPPTPSSPSMSDILKELSLVKLRKTRNITPNGSVRKKTPLARELSDMSTADIIQQAIRKKFAKMHENSQSPTQVCDKEKRRASLSESASLDALSEPPALSLLCSTAACLTSSPLASVAPPVSFDQ